MSKKEDEAYEKWAEGVKSNLSDEQKANFDSLVESDSGKEIFRGHLRENEFYTRLNKLNEDRRELESDQTKQKVEADKISSWFAEAKPEYDEALTVRQDMEDKNAELTRQLSAYGLGDDTNLPNPNTASHKETEKLQAQMAELQQKLQFMDQGLPQLMTDHSAIIRESIKNDFSATPEDVVRYSNENKVPIRQAFEILTKDERQARVDATRSQEIEDAKATAHEEGRREALENLQTPDHLRPSGPSILDTIAETGAKPYAPKRHELSKAATAMYLEEFAGK